MDVRLLFLYVLCWLGQKFLMTAGNLLQYRILQYTIFKDELFMRHHDVALFDITPLLKT